MTDRTCSENRCGDRRAEDAFERGAFPVRHTGPLAERRANFETHSWADNGDGEPPRCWDCDAATYHAAAEYPCGAKVPRTDNPRE